MAKNVLLTCGEVAPSPLLTHPTTASRVDGLDLYALETFDLEVYAGLLISTHADQRFLMTLRPRLDRFLQNGGTLVFCGHLAYPFLPEVAPFVPLTVRSIQDYRVWRVRPHPIFSGVQADDLTFRKGVAGFYGRGHNPPPPHAVILNRLGGPNGAPVDYLYERPGGGVIFVHAGNDLWMDLAEESSASWIAPQLLDWIESREPSDRIREES